MLLLDLHNPDYFAANISINTLIELDIFRRAKFSVKTHDCSHTTIYY